MIDAVLRPEISQGTRQIKQNMSFETLSDLKLIVVPSDFNTGNCFLEQCGEMIEVDAFLSLMVDDALPANLASLFVVIRHDFTEENQFEPFLPKGVPPMLFYFAGLTLSYQKQHHLWMVMTSRRSDIKCSQLLNSIEVAKLAELHLQ